MVAYYYIGNGNLEIYATICGLVEINIAFLIVILRNIKQSKIFIFMFLITILELIFAIFDFIFFYIISYTIYYNRY